MVNTRKMSYVPPTGEGDAQTEVLSDSSTASSTTTRRLTRRSLGTIAAQNSPSVPTIPTPVRRSRRLSNSSVESLSITDGPQPAVSSRPTRSSRAKSNAGSDSDNDAVKNKKRKLVEPVENLGPITEEKVEGDGLPIAQKEDAATPDVKQVEEESKQGVLNQPLAEEQANDSKSEVTIEEAVKPDKMEVAEVHGNKDVLEPSAKTEDVLAEDERPSSAEFEEIPTETSTTDVPVGADQIKLIECESSDSFQSATSTEEDTRPDASIEIAPSKYKTKEHGVKSASDAPDTTETAASDLGESKEPTEPTIEIGKRPEESTVENGKAHMALDKSVTIAPINERLLKISNQSVPREKKAIPDNKSSKEAKPAQQPLPCGADIMRNIPRGKCKSGREWKPPKSNPRYLYQDKGLKMPFEKITQLRLERQRVKELENRLKEEERARREELKRRREINKLRTEENAKRGEVVQVIRNSNKIKRMKKKQLKLIQKRDTTVTTS